MIGIGQIINQAFGALWRLRWTVLPLTVVWLAIDGLLFGYLRTHSSHPLIAWVGILLDPRVIGHGVVATFLMANALSFISDAVRAICVVIIFRALLRPSSEPARGQPRAFIFPMVLVLLFEVAWTAIRWTFEEVAVLATSIDLIDRQTLAVVGFVGYSLAMSRLCFAYPRAALGLGLRLQQSWHDTRALALRLFLIFLAVALPFVMLHRVLSDWTRQYVFATDSYEFAYMYMTIAGSVGNVPRDVLILAVIAVAYVATSGTRSDAIPGANQIPKRPAGTFD